MIRAIKIDQVIANPDQPRKHFDAAKLASLKKSITRYGIQNPIQVREIGKDKYMIVNGERRYRAASDLKWKEIPINIVIVKDELDELVMQFHMQEQDESWSGVEKANAILSISDKLNVPLAKLCEELAINTKSAARYLAYAQLTDKAQFERSDIPLDYALGIHEVKNCAKRVYEAETEEEFSYDMTKKLERSIVNKVADGLIGKRQDLVKLKDAFTKDPKSILKFIEDTKLTPDQLFVRTKAKGAHALRNIGWASTQLRTHIVSYLSYKDVLPSAEQIAAVKRARDEANNFLAAVSD